MSDLIRQQIPATGLIEATPAGSFFYLLETAAPVTVIFDYPNESKKIAGIGAGYKLKTAAGKQDFLRARVLGAAGSTVAFFIGDDEEDYLGTVQLTTIQRAASLSQGADVVVGAGATAISAANAARKRIIITNLDASAGNVRIGGAGVLAGAGLQVQPGMSVTIETTAAVYAIREGAGAATVAATEEIL